MAFKDYVRPTVFGAFAAFVLAAVYMTIVSFISGWEFAQDQFRLFWHFVVGLTVGFGIQIGLYTYLKQMMRSYHERASGKVVAVTGTTSTLAMISCCIHYVANIVPILGIAGILSIVGQYQKELFGVGLAFNFFGIAFLVNKVYLFKKEVMRI